MEKILLAIDATNPKRNALEFACYLARLTKSKVTGIFLENQVPAGIPILKQLQKITSADWGEEENIEDYKARQEELIENSINHFKHGCICRDVNYNWHRDRGIPINELVEESRFADLLITDAATSFSKQYDGIPSEFVKDVLKKAECPVVIAPESFGAINEIIFAYNGSSSSVFAIKQFTYLFPQLCHTKAIIIKVTENGEWNGTDKHHLTEWLKDHYTDLEFEALKGNNYNRLFEYLFKRKNMILVMGAYGRNALSEFIKPNPADLLLKTVTQPIFIAHL
ncbi:universal stress protein [Ferruginibacter sp.]|nr:universal stress protein [Ferruginibacter sp.]